MDFDAGEVLNRAWQIVRKHRVLWFYGFLQTMAGLLLLTTAVIPAIAPLISDRSVGITNEPWFVLIFVLVFLLFILVLYPLSVVMNAALSVGVLRAEHGQEKLSFMELVRESFPFFWRLLGLMLLFLAGLMLAMFVFSMLQTLLSVITLGLGAVCTAPLSLLTYPLTFVWYAYMEQSMAAIVADNMNVLEAAKQGWEVLRKNTEAVVVIGLVLYFGLSIITGLALAPMIVPLFAIPFAIGLEESRNALLLFASVCAAVYVPLFAIFQGVVMAFMKSGWILTYLRLTRSSNLHPLLQEATS